VESVSAELDRFVHRKRTKGDDHSLVVMRFAPAGAPMGAGGGIGVAENSWARSGGLDDRAEVYGSQGMTVADLARGSALSTYSEPGYGYAIEKGSGTQGWTQTGFEEAWSEGFPQEIAHFVECVRDGLRPALTGEDGRAVLEIICAAYESARTGRRVSLPFETDASKPVDLWLRK
ncbi:MAG: Gfo/Idh/MocA family oxidoreductase, partial [Dehalococcoidia bacterium]